MDFRGSQHTQRPGHETNRFAFATIPFSAIAFLALTALVSLLWSHNRLLYRDEFYQMWTDRVSSIGQMAHIQLTNPVALDPLAFHIVAHACIRVFGANAFAIRLPSLLSVLMMQVCIFIFVRRLGSERAAVFAMGFPALTCVMGYSLEGRPYGFMLGLFGLAMVSWQTAARRETDRSWALIVLATTLAIVLNTHFFGVLLLGPLAVAEVYRAFERKRLDFSMIASLAVGSAGIVFALPFLKAAKEFRRSYGSSSLSLKALVWPYIWTLANHTATKLDRLIFVAVGAVVLISLWTYGRGLIRKTISSHKSEQVFLVALTALPFFGYAATVVTSSFLEPRFVVGLVIGIAALTALGLFSLCQSDRSRTFALTVLFVAIASTGAVHIRWQYEATRQTLDSMKLQPEIKAALLANPTRKLYIQDMESFAAVTFYEPDPEVRSRAVLLYSEDQEMKWNQESIIPLTALHLHNFDHTPIVAYEDLAAQPGEHIFLDFAQPSIRSGRTRSWNWIGLALVADDANVKLLGHAFRANDDVTGDVVSAEFSSVAHDAVEDRRKSELR
jgi:4-amino-4-deoxy-L-arabinose transferase-like glycosyltransferase